MSVHPDVLRVAMESLGPDLAVLDWLKACPGRPADVAFATMLEAALAEIPRATCRAVGHDSFVLQKTPGPPYAVMCGRCSHIWTVEASSPPDPPPTTPSPPTEAAPVPPVTPVAEPKGKPPAPRRALEKTKAPPKSEPKPEPEAEAAPETPARDTPREREPAESAETPVADDVPKCRSCGGELESVVYAAEVKRNFQGAELCRDCLLTCEDCGNKIDSMDEGRLGFIRWRLRLDAKCQAKRNTGSSE